jgi:hypothetical protein
MPPSTHLRTEKDEISETFCFLVNRNNGQWTMSRKIAIQLTQKNAEFWALATKIMKLRVPWKERKLLAEISLISYRLCSMDFFSLLVGYWLYSQCVSHSVHYIVFSPPPPKRQGRWRRAHDTGRATAAWRRSDCQLLRIEGATWSAWRIPTAVFSVF